MGIKTGYFLPSSQKEEKTRHEKEMLSLQTWKFNAIGSLGNVRDSFK